MFCHYDTKVTTTIKGISPHSIEGSAYSINPFIKPTQALTFIAAYNMTSIPLNRTTGTQAIIWLCLGATVFSILLINMHWEYALLRASVISIGAYLMHSVNRYYFNKYISTKNWRAYAAYAIATVAVVSVIRYAMENYLLPMGSQPFYVRIRPQRPLFYILTTSLTVFLSATILYAEYLTKREKEMLQIINRNNDAKLQYLQAQINPHFLFNAMNNIYSLIVTGSPQTAEMMLTLTDMLRYSIYQKERAKVALSEEAKQIEFLIKLFNLRSYGKYNISFEKENIHGSIEPMILLPLVENSLKHCDFNDNEQAYATIKLIASEDHLLLTTENTFSNYDNGTESGGIGILNITERLQLLYPGRYTMHTSNANNIYKVELKIQWQQ